MKKRLLLFYFALCTIFGISAVDFEVDGILYNELSPTTVEVTYGDKKYTGDVNIPSCVTYNERKYTVTSIGREAFYHCEDLKSVTIPSSVTSIGVLATTRCTSLRAFYGKFASVDNRCLIVDGEIKAFAPSGLAEYSIPQSATSIGFGAFTECFDLTSVNIPNSVTYISDFAFINCEGLTSVTIPVSMTFIGAFSFNNCERLTSVTCLVKNPSQIIMEPSVFDSKIFAKSTLYVPEGSEDMYKTADQWKDFTHIVGI